jgi:hypothetical protein
LLFVAVPSLAAAAQTITIIDNNLRPIPLKAESAIRSLPGWGESSGCNFIGRVLPIGKSSEKTLVVTTSAACAWGAAQGPLFLLRQSRGSYTVLLETVGYSISLRPTAREGKTTLRVVGQHSYSDYHLQGDRYVKDSTYENR